MTRIIYFLLALTLGGCATQRAAAPTHTKPPTPVSNLPGEDAGSATIKCEGVILSFAKDGFQGLSISGICETMDVTVLRITAPDQYAGVEQMFLSRTENGMSPYGKVGDHVTFNILRTILISEAEQQGVIR
jgi:hypothetical protein